MSYADAQPMPRWRAPLDPVHAAVAGLENKLRAEATGSLSLARMWHESASRAFARWPGAMVQGPSPTPRCV